MRFQSKALTAVLAIIASIGLAACERRSAPYEERAPAKTAPRIIETAWTPAAAERAAKLSEQALKDDPKDGGRQYALPEIRVYDGRQQLLLHSRGVQPGKTAARLDAVIAGGRRVEGPSFAETLADLETPAGVSATTAVSPASRATIVEYWAEWCVPCKALEKEVLAWASAQPAGTVLIVRAEADLIKLSRAKGEKVIMLKKGADGKMIKVEMLS